MELERDPGPATTEGGGASPRRTLLICGAIALAGGGLIAAIFSTEPEATRESATRRSAMLVELTSGQAGTFRPTIVAMGRVRPAQEVVLRPRVAGEVVARADAFVPGGFVDAGETLLRIERDDYENRLQQRRSELRQALADLEIEMGRQDVARREYELLGESISGGNEDLVLRKPQLDVAKARIASARAAVGQAELDLERTTIRAPFDAHVLSRDVDVGSQVEPGDALARLVGVETYWVETTVPVSKLRWLSFPELDGELDGGDDGDGSHAPTKGSEVRIRDRNAWGEDTWRTGRLYKLVAELDDQTRMARVLVAVDDPLALDSDAGTPRLMIGSYVEGRIQGRPIEDVVRLDRDYVRKNDTVWVMQDGRLDVRSLRIAFRDEEHVYVREGLDEDDRIVTTDLATVDDGAPLRVKPTRTDVATDGAG